MVCKKKNFLNQQQKSTCLFVCDRERGRGGGNKVMGEKERGVTNEGDLG